VQIADESALPPDSCFDREWAMAIIERSLNLLEHRCGDAAQFTMLKPWLMPAGIRVPQADAAAQLGMSADAVKVAIHRLRRRFRALVRAEVLQTLHDPVDLDDEMRHLVAALGQ
jgi:RNA polymerase sigma-70 factor (ECF subfamily)